MSIIDSINPFNWCSRPDEEPATTNELWESVKQLPADSLEIVKDEKWMTLASTLFGAASHSCSLMGEGAASFAPWLSIFSSPAYLYHSLKGSIECLKLVVTAIKVSRFADAFFWSGRAIGNVGSTLGDVIKPFAGCATLLGLANIPAVSLTFSYIFPIILIGLSVISMSTQEWAFVRSVKAAEKFGDRCRDLDGTLRGLERFLRHYDTANIGDINVKTLKESKMCTGSFTSQLRMNMVQQRIQSLINFDASLKLNALKLVMGDLFRTLNQDQPDPEMVTPLGHIEQTIDLCEQVLKLTEQVAITEDILEKVNAVKDGLDELLQLKATLYAEGYDIATKMQIEVERRIKELGVNILGSVFTLVSAVLILLFPQLTTIANALSAVSAVIGGCNVIYNKHISYKEFEQTIAFKELHDE